MTKELRIELKREYVRGMEEAKKVHKESTHAVLEIVRDRLTTILNDYTDELDVEYELEKVIQLIDEYNEGEITAKELKKKHDLDELEEELKELDTDDVISLTEFVRDDF